MERAKPTGTVTKRTAPVHERPVTKPFSGSPISQTTTFKSQTEPTLKGRPYGSWQRKADIGQNKRTSTKSTGNPHTSYERACFFWQQERPSVCHTKICSKERGT